MAENNNSCVSGVISAFFSGVLVGAGLALLFAPVTGKEIRHSIALQLEDLKEKIKELEKKLHKSGSKIPIETTYEEEIGV